MIAFHLYRWNYPPDQSIVQQLEKMNEWRDRFAPGRSLWDNEWGPNVDPEKDPARYADLVARHLVLDKIMGVEHSDCYTWNGHAQYRLWIDPFWPTPAAIAFRTTARHLTNTKPVAWISKGENGVFACVFEHAFGNPPTFVMVAWATGERQRETLGGIGVLPETARLADLMGNPLEMRIEDHCAELEISRKPIFLEGVDPSYVETLEPLPGRVDASPPRRHPDLWYSFHYPKGSEVVSLPYGHAKTLSFRLRNDGDQPVEATLDFSANGSPLQVSPARVGVEVPPKSFRTIDVSVAAPREGAEGPCAFLVAGVSDGLSCGEMRIRCHVANQEVQQFHMATWEMAQHVVDKKDSGQGVHIRWINPGGYLKFKFDLANLSSARLSGYMDGDDGGTFRIRVSRNQTEWDTLLEGRGGWAWRDVDLSPYVGGEVFVLFENPSDRGTARLKQMRLFSVPSSKLP